YVPEPSPAWFCVPPGFTRPTAPLLPVRQVCCVLIVLASASPGRLIARAATCSACPVPNRVRTQRPRRRVLRSRSS
ncbi:hypothetical protein MTR_1490s0010, partial [Medicago truncatula]